MDIFKTFSLEIQKKLVKSSFPSWISPMLATLTQERFSKSDWTYELKLDGIRVLAYGKEGKIQLFSRNKETFNKIFPDIENSLRKLSFKNFILDGELVVLKKDISSFSELQQILFKKTLEEAEALNVKPSYYIFDILYLDGYILTHLPLSMRKEILKKFIFFPPLYGVPFQIKEGEAYYSEICKKGGEGVIAKKLSSSYVSKRSQDWLKFKCSHQQEFIIIGFTPPKGHRQGFGALLLGYYKDGDLQYAGKVGTGFNIKILNSLHEDLKKILLEESLLKEKIYLKNVTWVNPAFVAEIAFTEWTKYRKLRHPRFLGLRRDKNAEDVVREAPLP